MIIHGKDIRGNATGSKILPIGINSKDEQMNWQILSSNDRKNTPNETKKNYIEMKREDFKLNTQKIHPKKAKENFQQLFLSDCFVLYLQKRTGSYHMLLSIPAYIFDPIP